MKKRILFYLFGHFFILGFFMASVNFASAAALALSPQSGTLTTGEILSVTILLNTQGVPIDAVDIYRLNYDPLLFEVQDEDLTTAGVQIAPGSLMPNTAVNKVDAAQGKIAFSQLVSPGTFYTNSSDAALATLRFKAKTSGQAHVTFDFISGSTVDSNVTSSGSDVLSSVINGSYTLQAPQDVTAPTISNVSSFGLTQTQATLRWTTDEPSTSHLDYGLTTAYGSSSVFDSTLVTSHSVSLAGLSAGTSYNYRVRSKDASGNESVSTNQVFTTELPPLADTSAPGAVTNIASSNITETSADLAWTATGDDGSSGMAASYDIRYSTGPITSSTWPDAAQANGEPLPKAAGSGENFSLVGLSSATRYFIAIRVIDEAGNASSLSPVITLTTSQSPGNPPPPEPKVILLAPVAGQCFEHGSAMSISWTIENADHAALSVTTDGGVTTPVFGSWFFMQDAGQALVTSYSWTVPTNITSDTVRIYVEAHNASHTQRLAIDALDANISLRQSCSAPQSSPSELPPAPAPASSGGGGGGGGYYAPTDTVPPPQVTDFRARGADKQITLLWKNPSNSNDWARTLIVKKEGGPASSAADGAIVYQGKGEEYTDTALKNGTLYYYSAYTLDRVPNYSKPAVISATPIFGVDFIPTVILSPVDTDGDTLTDNEEGRLGTDMNKKDTDDDGFSDDVEVKNGFDPINAPSKKKATAAFIAGAKGKILLQVKRRGEAWYVNPQDGKRYYLRDGNAAYTLMRFLGEGIRTRDLERIPEAGSNKTGDRALLARMKGKILLQVEKRGEAWYINPADGKRYYLKDGSAAYTIMRKLGVGALNEDIMQIPYARK